MKMDYIQVSERISQKILAKGHQADPAPIAAKLRRLVEEFGVPPAEAERTVTNDLAREFSIQGLGTGAGGGGSDEKQLAQFLPG